MKKPILNLAPFGEPAKADKSKDPSRVRLNYDNAAGTAELFIYGEIGGWWDGPDTTALVQEIAALKADQITVRINSPGGSVFDGVAIYNALAQHPAEVIVKIEGVAASIASVIAMAGDKIMIGEAANIMIHKPWSLVVGDAASMRKEADILDQLEGGLLDIYASRTGVDMKHLSDWIAAETWFRGQQAVEEGFADEIIPAKTKKAQAARSQIYAMFKNAPADLLTDGEDDEQPTVREFEQFLRGVVGMKANDAKIVVAAAKKFAPERDVPAIADERDAQAQTVDEGQLYRLANHIRSISK
jgi:ATP-dependent protease ClpP protease subunit